MTPGSFDPSTARKILGDELARKIETCARHDADRGYFSPPEITGPTYWECVKAEMQFIVYCAQFMKRFDKNLRSR